MSSLPNIEFLEGLLQKHCDSDVPRKDDPDNAKDMDDNEKAPNSTLSPAEEMAIFETLFTEQEAIDLADRTLNQDPTLIDDIRRRANGRLSERFFEELQLNLGLMVMCEDTCLQALTSLRNIGGPHITRRQKKALNFFINMITDAKSKDEGSEDEIPLIHVMQLRSLCDTLPDYRPTILSCIGYLVTE